MKCPKCETVNPADSKFCKECATPLPSGTSERVSFTRTLETANDELTRGTVFAGRYEIIEELGAGGMGRVYRVHDTKLNEEVALKLIKSEIAAERRVADRFRNELKVARKIRHKNVCGMYDFHEEGRTLYLTMEYVKGEDLKSLIHRTRTLSVGTALGICRQIAEGLAEAHKLGVTHRDLKPGNVMIDKDGNAKIMDFGIARSLVGGGGTAEGAIIGTPEYMSPEQVEGKSADPRADVYALGVILFEMVTGRVPFDGETPFAIANKHKTEPPPVPKKLAPQIPEGLNRIILRCLEKEREKRYPTAEEFLADMESVDAGLPTTELPAPKRRTATPREVTIKFQPRKLAMPAFAVLGLAVGGFFLWRNVLHRPAPPLVSAKPALAIFDFENVAKEPSLDSWRRGFNILLTTQLGQSRYVQVMDELKLLAIRRSLGLGQMEPHTSDDLKRIAAEGGLTHFVTGSYLPAGGKIIVNVSLIDGKTGAALKPLQVEAQDKDALADTVDRLAEKIKSALDIVESAVDESLHKRMGDVYSKNPQALEAYLLGEQYRQYGPREKAIPTFERAIQIDPQFAMAYRILGSTYGNQRDFVKQYEYLRKAYDLREALPEKERFLIEGNWLELKEKDIPKANKVFAKIVERYPDSYSGRFSFARTSPDLDTSVREYEYLLHVRGYRVPMLFGNLTSLYCFLGEPSKARACWEESIAAFPSDSFRLAFLGNLFLIEQNLDAARDAYARAEAARASFDVLAERILHDLAREDLVKAQETLDKLRPAAQDQAIAEGWQATLFMASGKFGAAFSAQARLHSQPLGQRTPIENGQFLVLRAKGHLQCGAAGKALDDLREAMDGFEKEQNRLPITGATGFAPLIRETVLWQMIALSDLGRVGEAEALLKTFPKLIPERYRNSPKVALPENADFASGKIALAKQNSVTAARYLEKCLARMPGESLWSPSDHAYLLDALAEAYALAGDVTRAAEIYARIPKLSYGRLSWEAVYARSYYRLGQVFERMGKPAEARGKYRKFLELWKDADPGLTEVEDAKKRLAALMSR